MTKKDIKKLEKELWAAADNLRANSDLKSAEYSIPVLGLIFLKFADNKYRQYQEEIEAEYTKLKKTRRKKKLSDIAIQNVDSIWKNILVMIICWICLKKKILPKRLKKQWNRLRNISQN